MTLPSPYSLPVDGKGATSFTITSDDTAYIVFSAYQDSTPVYILMKTSINRIDLSLLNASFYINIQQFVVSPNNRNIVYSADYSPCYLCPQFSQSFDQGQSFSGISSSEHSDGRCLFIWKSFANPDSDIVYFGCDGGICKKRMGRTHTESITGSGLAINEFYGVGNNEVDENIAVASAQDNGGFSYIKNRSTYWKLDLSSLDGDHAKMMQDNITHPIGESNPPGVFEWTLTSTTSSANGIGSPSDGSGSVSRPLYFDKNDVAYIGYSHIFKKLPSGGGWSNLFSADPIDYDATHYFPKQAIDFYINESNSDTAYIAYAEELQGRINAFWMNTVSGSILAAADGGGLWVRG
jgi:hypothetical protein